MYFKTTSNSPSAVMIELLLIGAVLGYFFPIITFVALAGCLYVKYRVSSRTLNTVMNNIITTLSSNKVSKPLASLVLVPMVTAFWNSKEGTTNNKELPTFSNSSDPSDYFSFPTEVQVKA